MNTYKQIKQRDDIQYNVNSYIADTYTDMANIPLNDCEPGSKCFVIDTSETYILNLQNTWVKQA